jgi:outer membrane protein TolC
MIHVSNLHGRSTMLVRLFCVAIVVATAPSARAYAQERPPAPQLKLDLRAPNGGRMSMAESIAIALARNPALTIERMRVDAANAAVQAERGTLEPVLNVSQGSYRRDNIVASRFYPTGLYIDSEHVSRVNVESKTLFGGSFTAGIDYRQLSSTSNIQTLSPQYSTNLVFSVSQPLLRDFGHGKSMSSIRLSEERARVAEQTFVLASARLIVQTEEEYWRWAFAREQVDVRRRSRDAAARLLAQTDTLFGAGKAAPSSVQQARAALAQREEDAVGAAADAESVEDRLKLLLRIDLASQLTPADRVAAAAAADPAPAIVPAAMTISRQAASLDPSASIESALRRRPELIALERERVQREIELTMARNLLLPRLDLSAQYMRSGMAGTPSTACVDPTALVCVPAGSDVAESIFATLTQPGDAFNSLFGSQLFDGWSAELKLQVPLGMRTAKARRTEAELKLAESRLRLEAARDEVVRDVREAVRQATTAQARYDAARQVATYARSQFTTARTQFDAGLASTFDVVRTQDDLDRASLEELKAQMELNIALSRVRLADMTVLDDHAIAGAPRATAGSK